MTIQRQIDILSRIEKKIKAQSKENTKQIIEINEEIAVIKDLKNKLMRSIGIKTEEDLEHERFFN